MTIERSDEMEAVLELWFGDLLEDPEDLEALEAQNRIWWAKDADFDAQLREHFGHLWRAAAAGERDHWAESARGRLALIIVLDQFSRNLHRGSPKSWAQDDKAVALTLEGLERGHDQSLHPTLRVFLLMPLMHAEDRALQDRSCAEFAALAEACEGGLREVFDNNLRFAEQHRDIVERFGRFPHRNAILGRDSSAEELAFLEEPGSSF